MKKKTRMIWLIIVAVMVISIICPNNSYAVSADTIGYVENLGGKLLGPITDIFVTLCDGLIDISQKALFGEEGDAIVDVDRDGISIPKALGIFAGIAVLAGCVALAVFLGPATTLAAKIVVGVGTAVLSVGKVVKTYFIVSMISSAMLNSSFQLPFIVISPENIIQNKIGMFDVNFFSENTKNNENDNSINIANELHLTIAKWYYLIRNLVIVIFMILLIYIGIKILITSISEDKAKYKKMLVDWFVSFALVFVIHYIMVFSMNIVNEFTKLVSTITNDESVEYFEIVDDKVYDYVKENLVDSDKRPSWTSEALAWAKSKIGLNDSNSGEYTMIYINEDGKKAVRFPVDNFLSQARIKEQLLDEETSTETYASIGWKLIYIMLTLLAVKFGWIYIKRVVYIAFLILIAPFVVLTYSIDRFRDGQAQGFNTWLREYLFNLAIQPFHIILYTVFVGTAMTLASKSPIYVLVVLGFMSEAEKILRNMFGFQKATTPGVLSGAVGTGVAMSALQKVFGKKPPQANSNKYLENMGQKGTSSNSRITEHEVDPEIDIDPDIDPDDENKGILDTVKDAVDDVKENAGFENENNEQQNKENKSGRMLAVAVNNIRMNRNSKQQNPVESFDENKKVKKKAKLKLGKALKGAGRHYAQAKGRALANRAMNTDYIGGAKRAILGGAAALTTGTAGVILGAMDGSPEKAARNAILAGTASYKSISNMVGSNKVEGMSDAFLKAGYGSDYGQYQNQKLASEIKSDIEKKYKLTEEFDWDKKELDKFLKETVDEYIESGVKQFDDMVIGEKLKRDGIAKNTKEAIGIMAMGQRVGADTTKLTEKKKQEWAETFMEKNSTMSRVQEQLKQKQKDYDKQIKNILNQKLEKNEEKMQVQAVEIQRNNDQELNKLKKNVETFQVKVFEKLDKYSEYKYKE